MKAITRNHVWKVMALAAVCLALTGCTDDGTHKVCGYQSNQEVVITEGTQSTPGLTDANGCIVVKDGAQIRELNN